MADSSGRKRICVIGAGPSGLACMRQLLDEGHEVVCFERTSEIGGIWFYQEQEERGARVAVRGWRSLRHLSVVTRLPVCVRGCS